MPWLAQIHGKPLLITQEKQYRIIQYLVKIYFRQIQSVFLTGASNLLAKARVSMNLKIHGRALNQVTRDQGESASLLYTVKTNIWPEVCQQALNAISINTQT